jgi:ribosomal-protein-alanine N-acetyltransferase
MKYAIRPLEERDIDDVVRAEEIIYGTTLGYDMLRAELKINPFANYFVLEINGGFGGYIGLWIHDETAEIINFLIMKEYQGLGFGKMMMNFVIDLCESVNVKTISLEVRKDNEKAIGLYEKLGFTCSHVRKNYYTDSTDALVLIKHLR